MDSLSVVYVHILMSIYTTIIKEVMNWGDHGMTLEGEREG